MSTFGKIRAVGTVFTLLVVWVLVLVVVAQKNRIADIRSDASALREQVARIEAPVRTGGPSAVDLAGEMAPVRAALSGVEADLDGLGRRLDALDAAVAASAPTPAMPDHGTDIARLETEVSELKRAVGDFNKALRGLQLSINARTVGDL